MANSKTMLAVAAISLMLAVMAWEILPVAALDLSLAIPDIDQEFGRSGQLKDGVYKLSFPRTDLGVSVHGIKVKPGLALGSWVAFKGTRAGAVVHGDLVLKPGEVAAVMTVLDQRGLTVTALHNHLIEESPHVMYLHFWGRGDAAQLAKALKEALVVTGTPLGSPQETVKAVPGFDVERLQEQLGHKGVVEGGVLKISILRRENISMESVGLPPSMGMATALNFQAGRDGKVAATGDFVLTAEEVSRVGSSLTRNGILITALHNHLVQGDPELYFMHFWTHGTIDEVAMGLKAALNEMKPGRSE